MSNGRTTRALKRCGKFCLSLLKCLLTEALSRSGVWAGLFPAMTLTSPQSPETLCFTLGIRSSYFTAITHGHIRGSEKSRANHALNSQKFLTNPELLSKFLLNKNKSLLLFPARGTFLLRRESILSQKTPAVNVIHAFRNRSGHYGINPFTIYARHFRLNCKLIHLYVIWHHCERSPKQTRQYPEM